jgi:hypothetical protein
MTARAPKLGGSLQVRPGALTGVVLEWTVPLH